VIIALEGGIGWGIILTLQNGKFYLKSFLLEGCKPENQQLFGLTVVALGNKNNRSYCQSPENQAEHNTLSFVIVP
jgi:hypothetical protein